MKKFACLLLTFAAFCLSVCAETLYYLPHIANGQAGATSIRTTFIVLNRSGVSQQLHLILTKDNGDPLPVTLTGYGSPQSTYLLTLNPGQTRFLQTDGNGSLASGAAYAQAYSNNREDVGLSAVFSIYQNGRFATEAGVGDSQTSGDFIIPVDSQGPFNTGVAIYNAGGAEAQFSIRLFNESGQQIGSEKWYTVVPGGHMAKFVTGANEYFPSVASHRGVLWLTGGQGMNLSALTIRQIANPLSFTTLPAVPVTATRRSFNLPQVGNGRVSGLGVLKTTFVLFNAFSGSVTATVTLTRDDGTPFPVTIPGVANNTATFQVNLPGYGSAFLQTDGTGDLAAGSARITASANIGVSAIFTLYDEQGNFKTEAGVGESATFDTLTLPVDTTGSFNTGVALFNPNSTPLNATMRFLDLNGDPVAPADTIQLPGYGHKARYVTEFVSGQLNRQGSLIVEATPPVVAVALRQHADPLVFSTLPVLDNAFLGQARASALLPRNRSEVEVESDTTVDVDLPVGLKLSGTITAPAGQEISSAEVTATSGQTRFIGSFNPANNQYLVIVPSGQYTVSVRYKLAVSSGANLSLSYTHPSVTPVTADTARDLSLPSADLTSVKGQVSGLGLLPAHGEARVHFWSTDRGTESSALLDATGAFALALPGSEEYSASVVVQDLQIPEAKPEQLAFYLPKTTTVPASGEVAVAASLPPMRTLSGSSPAGSKVRAVETQPDSESSPFSQQTSSEEATYRMTLVKDRTYKVSATLDLFPNAFAGGDEFGVITFPVPAETLTLGGDAVRDRGHGEISGQVTIQGRVRRPDGSGVAGCLVLLSSNVPLGLSGFNYSAGITTDSEGYYSFNILKGGNYSISFIPPRPMP
ncbi:MAG: carboxypeptidase regulatory-like domain-containing protein [Acidobacteria bacterium]|nr:MAG: carboxypeptidase regulatory-like domain-containing protein [Acidobacteriota bacterium]